MSDSDSSDTDPSDDTASGEDLPIETKDDDRYERPDDWGPNLQVIDLFELSDYISRSTLNRAVDYMIVEDIGISSKKWAFATDRSKQTVRRNVRNMKQDLEETTMTDSRNLFERLVFESQIDDEN
jgi:hypothetical protein